jgi:hypothetical protein
MIHDIWLALAYTATDYATPVLQLPYVGIPLGILTFSVVIAIGIGSGVFLVGLPFIYLWAKSEA